MCDEKEFLIPTSDGLNGVILATDVGKVFDFVRKHCMVGQWKQNQSRVDMFTLYNVASSLPKNGRVLEIGSASGISTFIIQQSRPDLTIECVDIEVQEEFENASQAAQSGKITMNEMPSSDYKSTGMFDLIHIDGDHTYEGVMADETHAQQIKPGGIVMWHDYGNKKWPGVKKAVDEQLNGILFEFQGWEDIPLDDGTYKAVRVW